MGSAVRNDDTPAARRPQGPLRGLPGGTGHAAPAGPGPTGPVRGTVPAAVHASRAPDGGRPVVSVRDFGALHVSTLTFPAQRARSGARMRWRPSPTTYHVTLPLNGRMRVDQAGCEVILGAGTLYLHDTSRPYEIRAAGGDGPVVSLGVHVPRELVPLPRERVDGLTPRVVPAREGVGALLADFLTRLTAESGPARGGASPFGTGDAVRLGATLLSLVAALLGHELEAGEAAPAETPQQCLTRRIRDHIERHLDDPALTPASIAARHHISASHLHRLFQDEGMTVGAWVRHQRLERCRRDLADRTKRATPIHLIAARWGFAHAAAFSRAFRGAYGMAPKEYRRQAQHAWHGPAVEGVPPRG